jgi:hypothetical protein
MIVSYFVTKNLDILKRHWNEHGVLEGQSIFGTDSVTGKILDKGGEIVILDWETKAELLKKTFRSPSGIDCTKDNAYVVSRGDNRVYVTDRSFNTGMTVDNIYFNDLHSISATSAGFMVTSSGVDAVLEFDGRGTFVWGWWATENNYNIDMLGNRKTIERGIDHRGIDYPTLSQTTHINSAIHADDEEGEVLATLFHQGEVIEIDKKTGLVKVLLRGLRQPHALHRYGDGFVVSDTNNGRVLMFDREGGVMNEVHGDFNWLQDAILLSNGNYMVADANNFRLVEVDSEGSVIDSHYYGGDRKIFGIIEDNE